MKKVSTKKIQKLNTEETKKVCAGIQDIGDGGRDCGMYCFYCHPDHCPQNLQGKLSYR